MFSDIYRNSTEKTGKYVKELSLSFPKLKTELKNSYCSLAHKSDFAGHVIITTGLRRMHFPRPGIFLRWNSNLQQVDFSQGFASNNILGLVVLAVNDGFLHLHV